MNETSHKFSKKGGNGRSSTIPDSKATEEEKMGIEAHQIHKWPLA